MSHEIHQMTYVGKEPWHGLGTQLPANADYYSIVQAAGFYTAIERDVFAPPMESPLPDKKALFREDNGAYLATVNRGYEVIQFADVARTLVEAAGGVRCIFHTAGTLGRNGVRGWLLGELSEPMRVRGDPAPSSATVWATAVMMAPRRSRPLHRHYGLLRRLALTPPGRRVRVALPPQPSLPCCVPHRMLTCRAPLPRGLWGD